MNIHFMMDKRANGWQCPQYRPVFGDYRPNAVAHMSAQARRWASTSFAERSPWLGQSAIELVPDLP